jgi:hypothetical protein
MLRFIAQRPLRNPFPVALRNFHSTPYAAARKDAQDKDSIDRSSIEYTRSGTDSSVAENKEASFDPKSTRPEEESAKASKGNEV